MHNCVKLYIQQYFIFLFRMSMIIFKDTPHSLLSGGLRRLYNALMQRCSMETACCHRLHGMCTRPQCSAQTPAAKEMFVMQPTCYHVYIKIHLFFK